MIQNLWATLEFWLAVAFASLVKLTSGPLPGWRVSIVSVTTAFLAASLFTGPVVEWLDFREFDATAPVAALVALTGEHLARQIMGLKIMEVLKAWRGTK